MEQLQQQEWEKVQAFHGHACPGLASGYRMAKAALRALGYTAPEQGDLVTIAESDRCTIDPFQIVLGCTVGKGKLYTRLTGKQAFTVGCRKSGRAVRVIARPYEYTQENDDRRRKVMSGQASDTEYRQYKAESEARIKYILAAPEEELLSVQEVTVALPEKEMIYASPCCAFCGEQIMEPWARIRDGKVACVDCSVAAVR